MQQTIDFLKRHIKLVSAMTVLTVMFGTTYAGLYYLNRSLANDMPAVLAREAANILTEGASPRDLMPGHVDMNRSNAPFIIVYDKSGKPVSGSGYVGDDLAKIPLSMLKNVGQNQYRAVTWTPTPGVRSAAVITQNRQGYYVLGGQLLSATENRAKRLSLIVGGGYLLCLAITVLAYRLLRRPAAAAVAGPGSAVPASSTTPKPAVRVRKTAAKRESAVKKN